VSFSSLDDSNLVQKVQTGEKAAFAVLVERWQHKVYTQCVQQLRSTTLAEEATQDIFIKAYQGIGNFRFKSKFSTWLFRIVVNHCSNIKGYNYRRKQELHEPLEGKNPELPRELPSNQNNPHQLNEKKELKAIIHDCIAQLPDQQREILILRDIQEFSYEEICSILNLNNGTVKSRVHRAREALKPILIKRLRR